MTAVPEIRIRICNSHDANRDGEFVLYWMTSFRRTTRSFALDRAIEWAEQLQRPLVVLEALRCGHKWASDRMHSFVVDGMAENAKRFEEAGILYYPYLELEKGTGKGLLRAISERACVVVTDDYPCFFIPRMVAAAAKQVSVRMEAVDSNGLLPLRAAQQVFVTAYSFRRFLQKTLPEHLAHFPAADPLKKAKLASVKKIQEEIAKRWPRATEKQLSGDREFLRNLPIDHNVERAPARGGHAEARALLRNFLRTKLRDYVEHRNHPEQNVTSELSPYLHFGHISSHEIFSEIARKEAWNPDKIAVRASGAREGWWNMSASAEAYLDQVITWRELGYNFCSQRQDYDQFKSLPSWALKTLRSHARDERDHVYSLEELEQARTGDPLWNAAQTQLIREGRIHNYLRMLWGKKILEWTPSPEKALEIMIELNNKYGLDGRDPNSYSGIFWCLGRYDRPWTPERPIFGMIRYMSSANTARKLDAKAYMHKYEPGQKQLWTNEKSTSATAD
jgi:deoxyribodipyrimidine photo-lyase